MNWEFKVAMVRRGDRLGWGVIDTKWGRGGNDVSLVSAIYQDKRDAEDEAIFFTEFHTNRYPAIVGSVVAQSLTLGPLPIQA